MYIERNITESIKNISNHFKVVLLTGARQVGKSTLLKTMETERKYVSLDDPTEREIAINEPKLFLQRYNPPVLIDEIQYAPNLLSYIKIEVDNSEKNGQYWLTGSQQFHMMKNVSESLAGDLYGLSLAEINNYQQQPFLPTPEFIKNKRGQAPKYSSANIFDYIYKGSFPLLYKDKDADREYFYRSYITTYLERDIRDLTAVSDEMLFLKFIRIVAARTGQVLNYAEIASQVGISQPTVKSWLSVLISSKIVYLLEPYYINLTKRMTKMPKIYFLDTGLCSYLTKWNSAETIEYGAMSGAFFETFVVAEIIKSYEHNGKQPPLYWYRDYDGKEIDLLIEQNGKLYPIEIKQTTNPNKSMVKNFRIIKNMEYGGLICLTDTDVPLTENINTIPIGYI